MVAVEGCVTRRQVERKGMELERTGSVEIGLEKKGYVERKGMGKVDMKGCESKEKVDRKGWEGKVERKRM